MAKSEPKFSVIIITRNRVRSGQLRSALLSVQYQVYEALECIVVDDGSNPPAKPIVDSLHDARFRVVRLEGRNERLRGWNAGFKEAKGEWINMLCDDDILLPHCLTILASVIEASPDAKIFNFREANVQPNGRMWIRHLYEPKRLEIGHEPFLAGNISMGNFVFKRECLDEVGMFPDVNNFWVFADLAKEEFPWMKENCYIGELGNPWGEDYYLFFKLTRMYHTIPLDTVLMVKYPGKGVPVRFLKEIVCDEAD